MRVILLLLALTACGDYGGGEKEDNDPYFEETIRPLANRYCRGCHERDRFISSSTSWKNNSDLHSRLRSKNMPQQNSNEARNLSDKDRQTLIDY